MSQVAIPNSKLGLKQVILTARAIMGALELLCIFPEGGITRDGSLQPFKGGVMKILEGQPELPVVPLALQNLWGSYFSRVEAAGAMTKPFRRGLVAGPPLAAGEVSPELLRERVAALLAA